MANNFYTKAMQFFCKSKSCLGGFDVLNWDGGVLTGRNKELHTVTRMVHSFSLVGDLGVDQAEELVEHGLDYLVCSSRQKKWWLFLVGW